MSKLDRKQTLKKTGSGYPAPYDVPCQKRTTEFLGSFAGLTQFGVNLVTLPPGAWSSQRHWHSHEDEFVYMLEGTATLVTDEGETPMHARDAAGFKAGEKNGHCLKNLGTTDCTFLVVGSRNPADHGEYPDIDMKFQPGRYNPRAVVFVRKDGSPFEA